MKHIISAVCAAVCGASICIPAAAAQFGTNAREREVLVMQLALKISECSNAIERIEREISNIENDRKELFKILSSIKVPEYKVVTNTVKYASGAVVKTVNKRPFKQEARVRRLVATMRHPVISELYEKYCGASCTELLNEFIGEWKMAEEGFNDTKKMLENNSKAYSITTEETVRDAKLRYEEEMASFEDDIAALREKISILKDERQRIFEENKVDGKRLVSPRISELDNLVKDLQREIKDIELERNAVARIYKNNSFTISYAEAGNRKMDENDAVLAEADLRDQHQNLYISYSNKLKGDLTGVMAAKILSNKTLLQERRVEMDKLYFLLTHPDFIASDIAEAIVRGQVKDALSVVFGMDVDSLQSSRQNVSTGDMANEEK